MSLALVIFLVVVVGSTLQRVSGMGLGLIGGPILMLIMGPVEGILVINVLACVNAMLTTYSVRENVSWKKFGLIAPVMVIGSLAAALLIRRMDTAGLMIVVGAALLAALAVVTLERSLSRRWRAKALPSPPVFSAALPIPWRALRARLLPSMRRRQSGPNMFTPPRCSRFLS